MPEKCWQLFVRPTPMSIRRRSYLPSWEEILISTTCHQVFLCHFRFSGSTINACQFNSSLRRLCRRLCCVLFIPCTYFPFQETAHTKGIRYCKRTMTCAQIPPALINLGRWALNVGRRGFKTKACTIQRGTAKCSLQMQSGGCTLSTPTLKYKQRTSALWIQR